MDDATTYHRRLPHWRLDGSIYFVTWRLAFGQPDLNDAERQLVADALLFFNGRRYALIAFVVMNDHVHVLVQPREGESLQDLMRSWKGYTRPPDERSRTHRPDLAGRVLRPHRPQ